MGATRERRRNARGRTKRRYDARREAGLCTRCGLRPPVEGGTACEPCRDQRRAGERAQWAARRAAGLCGTCGETTFDGASRCAPGGPAVEERRQPQALRQAAGAQALHRLRRAVPGRGPVSAVRAPLPCALGRVSWPAAVPAELPGIEVATGADHGTFESQAEVAACLAFAQLSPHEVEIVALRRPPERMAGKSKRRAWRK